MRKLDYIALIPLLLGLGCLVSFLIIGTEMAPDGTIEEPFGLIPMGYFFLSLGTLAVIVLFIQSKVKNKD